jgi:hypothetical protein
MVLPLHLRQPLELPRRGVVNMRGLLLFRPDLAGLLLERALGGGRGLLGYLGFRAGWGRVLGQK